MKRPHKLEPYLHLYVLAALCGAQPLLDVLARKPQLFVAQGMEWLPPILALALVFVAPLALVAMRMVAARLGERAATAFDVAAVTLAAGVVTLQALNGSLGEYFPGLTLAIAAIVALAAGTLRARWSAFRTLLTFLAPALIAVPLVFVLDPRIARLRGDPPARPPGPEIAAREPVVMVIFDALSASALMDANERVNAQRYPNLASLADDAIWFTSASTVARWTDEAIPAMLTGDYPHPDRLPRLADHPRNLFTLLGDAYQVVAEEAVAELCPPDLNAFPRPMPPWRHRLKVLASDLGLVYLHRTLPEAYAQRLPAVDRAWGGFADPGSGLAGEIDRFDRFLNTLDGDAERTLYFLHVVIPHLPYLYLPSGKIFRRQVSKHLKPHGPVSQAPDLETRIFLYKRYLFQVGMVDLMIGELVGRLKQLGLYDRSHVVLTADHGGRNLADGQADDIYFVPLLIKPPFADAGRVERRPVSTLDLLPSMLELLGAEIAPSADGRDRSFFSPTYQFPESVYGDGELVPFDPARHSAKRDLIAWKLEHFKDGSDPRDLYRAGTPRRQLLDRQVDTDIRDEPRLAVELDLGTEVTYDPSSDFAPVLIEGSLYRDGFENPACCEVAVSINGRIEGAATARPHAPPAWFRFRVTIPESVLRPGVNQVRAWIVDPERPDELLRPALPEAR